MITLTHKGKTMTVPEWSRETGIPEPRLYTRLKRGLLPAEVLAPLKTMPSKTEARRYLSDLPMAERPKSLAKLLPNYKGKQWGVAVSEAHRADFDRWYEREFLPSRVDA